MLFQIKATTKKQSWRFIRFLEKEKKVTQTGKATRRVKK